MAYHSQSNWLGEPCRVRLDSDPDTDYERMRDEIEAQNQIDARQMKLFPRPGQGTQREGVA